MEEGSYFPDCQIASSTFTSGGLATIAAGAYPQVHGIVADSWYDRRAGKTVSASLEGMEATTLADQFAAADTHNRVYSVGMNVQDASLLAGRSATGVVYMDSEARVAGQGQLATAKWLEDLNRLNAPDKLKNSGWFALGARQGMPPLRTLTFDPAHPEEFFTLYRASPFGQAAQFAAAHELMTQERLGQSGGTDFLAVAIGSPALLGYEVGSDSPLMRELILPVSLLEVRSAPPILCGPARGPDAGWQSGIECSRSDGVLHGGRPEFSYRRLAPALSEQLPRRPVGRRDAGLRTWICRGIWRRKRCILRLSLQLRFSSAASPLWAGIQLRGIREPRRSH